MPAQQIAQNLAYINWTVLVGLAFGAFGAVVLARQRTDAPTGYLAFTALCAAAFGVLAWLSDGALPATGSDARAVSSPAFDTIRPLGLIALSLAALAWAIAVRRGSRAPVLGAAGIAAGLVALVAGALGWAGGPLDAIPLVIQFVVLSAATGGVFAAMVLGHWYLVTPKLGEGPLVLLARILLAVVGLQLALFVAWLGTGAGTGSGASVGGSGGTGTSPFGALVGPWALFVWLRLLVGLVFPLVISWAALQTARSRSMESATGLLYINVGAIAAGTILAAGLYFGAGLLT